MKSTIPNERKSLTPGLIVKTAAAAMFTVVLVFLLIFMPAGTWDYWEGWLYMGLFAFYFAAGTPISLWLMPDLVKRRLLVGPGAEKEKSQRRIIAFVWPVFMLLFILPGLDQRYEWSSIPPVIVYVALGLVVIGMALTMLTSYHNHYMASTITVEEGQPVISTGPYAWVRHPLYAATGLWFGATPVALGSWWGLIAAAALVIGLVARLLDEERYLRAHLPGYGAYCEKVRWRLVPGVF